MPDLLINPTSCPGWLHLQHLHVRRDADISARLSSRREICVQRVFVGICGLGLCWPLAFTGFRRNKDQERTVELIFFVEIHNRKLPDMFSMVLVTNSIILYFPILQCHLNVSVNLMPIL